MTETEGSFRVRYAAARRAHVPMRLRPQSLTARVLLVSTVWAVAALVVIGVVISALYRQGSERGFQDLLRAQLYNVINSIVVNDKSVLAGSPQLGDLRFSQPQTGWYWIVEPIGEFNTPPLMSTSLGSGKLPIASLDEVPFDIRYERFYTTVNSFNKEVEVAETEVVLDIQGHTARFRVAGNRDVLEADINDFNRNLYLALSIFGFGGIGMNALAILFGLRPLDQARRSLEKIRGGESERLDGEFPREIQPLASEVNALIDSNRRIIERARMQVGNLAHSLKTPIAVLMNEARVLEAPHGDLVKAQADAMQMQVQSYLNRARIAAQREVCAGADGGGAGSGAAGAGDAQAAPGKDLRADGLASGPDPRHGAAGCRGNGRQPPGQCRALLRRPGSHHGAHRAGGAARQGPWAAQLDYHRGR